MKSIGAICLWLVVAGYSSGQELRWHKWQRGDLWKVEVKQPENPQTYHLFIVVNGVDDIGKRSCWRLFFTPSKESGLQSQVVWLDKKSGIIRHVSPKYTPPGPTAGSITLSQYQGLIRGPLKGVPFETIPETEPQDTDLLWKAEKKIEGSHLLLVGRLMTDAGEEIVIRQRWVEGEKWWREYERFVNGRQVLSARIPESSAPSSRGTAPKENILPDGPRLKSLSKDPRLQVQVELVQDNPELEEVLRVLEKGTGLSFQVDRRLQDHRPRLGSVQFRNAPAWTIMNWIAQRDLVDGRWERVEDGYRLTAKESVARKKEPPPAAPKVALNKTEENRRLLAIDPKLQARVTIIANNPPLEEVLQRIREATGVALTLDPKIERHDPEFGSLQLPNTPAWTVMGLIAEKDLVEGRWEQVADGYRLTAQSSLREKPLPSASRWPITLAAIGFLLAISGLIVFLRWKRGPARQTGATQPKKV